MIESDSPSGGKLTTNAHLSIERVPDDTHFVTCTHNGPVETTVIPFTSCRASSPEFGDNVDEDQGIFRAPEDGAYEVRR